MIARDRFYSFASVYRAAADSLAGLLERTESRTSAVTAWFLSWPWGSIRRWGEACLAPTRVVVGAGHARPEALRNKSEGHSTRGAPVRGAACLARWWAILPRLLRQRPMDYH
jgi:hypothetical protein